MRQLTIAERLSAVLLPLAAMVSVPFLTAALMPFLDEANATFAEIFIAFVIANLVGAVILVMARGFVCPLAKVADTLDAIAYAELVSVTLLQPTRGELAPYGRDRQACRCHRRAPAPRARVVECLTSARAARVSISWKTSRSAIMSFDVPGHEGDRRRSRAQRWRRF
jgi:hypothetical protein